MMDNPYSNLMESIDEATRFAFWNVKKLKNYAVIRVQPVAPKNAPNTF